MQTIHDILDGYDRPARAHVIPGRKHAIRWTLEQARTGDAVVIAGCQRRSQASVAGRAAECRDAAIARAWLQQNAEEPSFAPKIYRAEN
jgi:UDP-N-acetylmuramoyl-L-alanyl-D-glutamate--2,6-diaminopimelate ligase